MSTLDSTRSSLDEDVISWSRLIWMKIWLTEKFQDLVFKLERNSDEKRGSLCSLISSGEKHPSKTFVQAAQVTIQLSGVEKEPIKFIKLS